MMTDASGVSAIVKVSESEPARPNLDAEQVTLLDTAAMLSLTSTNSDAIVSNAIMRMLGAHADEIDANGASRRARMNGEVRANEVEIAERRRLCDQLPELYRTRADRRDRITALEHTIAVLESELVRRRHAAEEAQIKQQIDALRQEELEAQLRAANVLPTESEDAAQIAERHRISITIVKEKLAEVIAAEKPALDRAAALAARSITQTVAGFLLWLGYGSVAATGAVLALIMNSGESGQFGVLIEGWRAIVESIPPQSAALRLFTGVLLVAALLTLVGLSIWAAEKLLLKDREDWKRDEHRNREPHVNLSPQSITRKTYTQFIALLPFLFAAGVIATILAVTPLPGTNGSEMLTSVLPTLGYAFVGIVIAFLATAVFVMYVVRIVEPRHIVDEDKRPSVLAAAWEFVIPPLVLVIAVVGAPLLLSTTNGSNVIAAREWVPWSAFMLLSSLALACGVVYHGVFKDARTSRDRIEALEAQLALQHELLSGGAPPADAAITRDYAEELHRLRSLRRDLRLRRLGVSITGRSDDASALVRAWRWIRRQPVVSAGAPANGTAAYRPIDYEDVDGANVIADLARARSERTQAAAELAMTEQSIQRLEELTSFEVMLPLLRRTETVRGEIDASNADDAELKSRAKITGEMLLLHARTVTSNGSSIRPFFEGVREDLSKRVPFTAIPASTEGSES